MSMLLRRRYEDIQGAANEVAPSPSLKKAEEKKPSEEAKSEELTLTAEDINKMTGPKIRKLAKENGIENPEELTVGELKAILCEKYS